MTQPRNDQVARRVHRLRVPIGIEKLLCRAASDDAFRTALLADRRAALEDAGYELAPTEMQVLLATSTQQLQLMIERIDLKRHARKQFMRSVATVAFAAAASVGSIACEGMTSDGSRPDFPDGETEEVDVRDIYPDAGAEVEVNDLYPEVGADIQQDFELPDPDGSEDDAAATEVEGD